LIFVNEEDEESYDPYKLRVRIKEIQHGGPSKVVWESDEGAIEGRFRFEGAGIYSLCVSNDHEEEDDDIDFAFSLRLRSLRRTEDPDELPGPDDKLTSSLLEGVRSIEGTISFCNNTWFIFLWILIFPFITSR